nr:hypothetical protein [uncultured bacterium]
MVTSCESRAPCHMRIVATCYNQAMMSCLYAHHNVNGNHLQNKLCPGSLSTHDTLGPTFHIYGALLPCIQPSSVICVLEMYL